MGKRLGVERQTVLGGLGVGEPRYGVHGVLGWDMRVLLAVSMLVMGDGGWWVCTGELYICELCAV